MEAFHCEKVLSRLDIKRAKALRSLIQRLTATENEADLAAAFADAEMIVLAMEESETPTVPPPPRRAKSAVGLRESRSGETRKDMPPVRTRSKKN